MTTRHDRPVGGPDRPVADKDREQSSHGSPFSDLLMLIMILGLLAASGWGLLQGIRFLHDTFAGR